MSGQSVARRTFLGTVAAQIVATQVHATAQTMKLVVGSDHAGFPMKGPVIKSLQSWGYTVKDCGTFSTDPVDFPDIARQVCAEITSGRAQRGIMVCGTGVGACIAANKIPGIRAALCQDTLCAHQCVEHDNVNVLCLGGWIIGPLIADEILTTFLNAKFLSSDPDFARRVHKLEEMDKR